MTAAELAAPVPEPELSEAARAAAALHANCGRTTCDDCGDDYDECECRFRDEYDATLCGDCVDGRLTRDEDNAAWRSYAY